MRKKISIIGTVGLPPKYGGFETLADNLAKQLGNSFDMTVVCSGKFYKEKVTLHNNAKLRYVNLNANGSQSVLYDIISIAWSLSFADTVLILGVSGAIVLPIVKLVSKKKLIVNIDGLEWKRQKWGWAARKFLKFSEMLSVKCADTVVADNQVIQDYVKQEYGRESVLIAYGGDHITPLPLSRETIDKYPFLKDRYALNICRIEPENNIHIILEAFAQHTALNLVVLGNWDANAYSRSLKEKYGAVRNIFLLDPMYDQVDVKSQIRSSCTIYVHGHSAGGTSPSLVEAMSMEKPVIAYSVNYNRATTENKAWYFSNAGELVSTLNEITEKDLVHVGGEMLESAKRMYTWETISSEYGKLF